MMNEAGSLAAILTRERMYDNGKSTKPRGVKVKTRLHRVDIIPLQIHARRRTIIHNS